MAESNTRVIAEKIVLAHTQAQRTPYANLIDAIDEALRNERERCAVIAETHDRTHSSGYRCYEGRVIADAIRRQNSEGSSNSDNKQ